MMYVFPTIGIAPTGENFYLHKSGCEHLQGIPARQYGYHKTFDEAVEAMLRYRPHLSKRNIYFCPACFPERFQNKTNGNPVHYRCNIQDKIVTVHDYRCDKLLPTDLEFLFSDTLERQAQRVQDFESHGYLVRFCEKCLSVDTMAELRWATRASSKSLLDARRRHK